MFIFHPPAEIVYRFCTSCGLLSSVLLVPPRRSHDRVCHTLPEIHTQYRHSTARLTRHTPSPQVLSDRRDLAFWRSSAKTPAYPKRMVQARVCECFPRGKLRVSCVTPRPLLSASMSARQAPEVSPSSYLDHPFHSRRPCRDPDAVVDDPGAAMFIIPLRSPSMSYSILVLRVFFGETRVMSAMCCAI